MTTFNVYHRGPSDTGFTLIQDAVTSKNYSVVGLDKGFEHSFKIGAIQGEVEKISNELRLYVQDADPNWLKRTLLIQGGESAIVNKAPGGAAFYQSTLTLSSDVKNLNATSIFATNKYASAHANVWNAIGSGDFCFSAWVYPTSYPGGGVNNDLFLFGSFNVSPNFAIFLTSGAGQLAFWDGTTQHTVSGGCPLNTWTFIELSRTAGVLRAFYNGVLKNQWTHTRSMGNSGNPNILSNGSGNRNFKGYVDDFSFYKGWGGHIADYTVPNYKAGNFKW